MLLEEIVGWIHDLDSKPILWLSGAAGTGKSSVANTIAETFYSLGRLGASFRFNRDVVQPETPSQLFGNLGHQLAHFDHRLREQVLAAIHSGCSGAMSLRIQARKLMVETTRGAEIVGPIVIVIDALDESGTDDGREPNRQTLVRSIVEELSNLPPSVKVLITSRDEGAISRYMLGRSLAKRMEDVPQTDTDILCFIKYRMVRIRSALFQSDLSRNWPGDDQETKLAQCADGLFIWAAVACEFLEDGTDDPAVKLDWLLNNAQEVSQAEVKLDDLYLEVIRRSLPKRE
jgi:hypothetical protein